MATNHQPAPGRPGGGRENQLRHTRSPHLTACLTMLMVGAIVTLAIQLLT